MKVFISWSGDRSRAVADLLDSWIKCVIQAVDPWMSSKDIDRGSIWFNEITDQLKDTNVGIVCLTQDNKNSPWILFESGALAKGLTSSRVCTLLIDLTPTDVANPLAQFNHTTLDKEGIFKLLRTINISLGEKKLDSNILENVFETYWPNLEIALKKALNDNPLDEKHQAPARDDQDILKEMLATIRSLDKRMRNIETLSNKTSRSGGLLSLHDWIVKNDDLRSPRSLIEDAIALEEKEISIKRERNARHVSDEIKSVLKNDDPITDDLDFLE